MTHYVCPGGCRAVTEEAGVCQASDCPRHGMNLEVCDCMDDKHTEVLASTEGGEEKIEE